MGRRRGPILALLLLLASCGAPQPPRLLLLLSVDTLRADRIGAYGGDRGLTPRIDALARESLVFSAAYAPASHTLPSVTSLLTGRYPEELGVWGNDALVVPPATSLALSLQEAGWSTSAVVSNWVLRRETGLSAGFHHYDDAMPQVEMSRPLPERIATDTTDAALAALDACLPEPDSRCFLWVHYQDPHGPYTPPGEHREARLAREREAPDGRRLLPVLDSSFGLGGIPKYQHLDDQREVAFYRAGYDGEVAYLDEEVGRLLDGVGERDLLPRTVVVFTADHGESLGEDDYWFGHGELLSEPLIRVPLLVRAPGVSPGTRSDLASLVDLVPTLTGLLLGAAPEPGQPGRALLAPGAEEAASTVYLASMQGSSVPRIGVVEGDFKYLVALRQGVWDGQLLRRGRDDVDLTAPAPHIASAMRDRLESLRERYRGDTPESRRDPSEAERERLRALGYLDEEDDPTPPAGPAGPAR
jgi:arylsulfatase